MRLIDRQQEAVPAAQLRQALQVREIACKATTEGVLASAHDFKALSACTHLSRHALSSPAWAGQWAACARLACGVTTNTECQPQHNATSTPARTVHAEQAVRDDEPPAAGRAGREQARQVRQVVVAVHAHGGARAPRQARAVDDGRVVQLVRKHHRVRVCKQQTGSQVTSPRLQCPKAPQRCN